MGISTIPQLPNPTPLKLSVDPGHEKVNYAALARGGNRRAAGNLPPFFETSTAAGGGGMLGLEHGMPAHRCLSSVVRRVRRRESGTDEILGMAADRLHAIIFYVAPVLRRQMEPRAERRAPEPRKRRVMPVHLASRWPGGAARRERCAALARCWSVSRGQSRTARPSA